MLELAGTHEHPGLSPILLSSSSAGSLNVLPIVTLRVLGGLFSDSFVNGMMGGMPDILFPGHEVPLRGPGSGGRLPRNPAGAIFTL